MPRENVKQTPQAFLELYLWRDAEPARCSVCAVQLAPAPRPPSPDEATAAESGARGCASLGLGAPTGTEASRSPMCPRHCGRLVLHPGKRYFKDALETSVTHTNCQVCVPASCQPRLRDEANTSFYHLGHPRGDHPHTCPARCGPFGPRHGPSSVRGLDSSPSTLGGGQAGAGSLQR